MRLFEWSIVVYLLVFIAWIAVGRVKQGGQLEVFLSKIGGPLLVMFHLVLEGYRWQMIPLYVLILIFTGISLLSRRAADGRSRWWARAAGAAAGLVLVIAAGAVPYLLPVPTVPQSDGPYGVGVITVDLTDPSREDIYASETGTPRRLLVDIWYPIDKNERGAAKAYIEYAEIIAPAISTWIEMPPYFLDHIRYAKTHGILDARLAPGEDRFPVILFSHGWGSQRTASTFLFEAFASHGYVVASIDHPHGSVTTVFPDGTVIPHQPGILRERETVEEYDEAARTLVSQWAEDIAFVVDVLTGLDQNDPEGRFTARLDLERVVVGGHSTGGGAAVAFCGLDARCKAGIPLDAWLVPVPTMVIQEGPQQPFLFLYSESWPSEKNEALFTTLFAGMPIGTVRGDIKGTGHYDFTDIPALSPLAHALGLKGPLDGKIVQEIIVLETLSFLVAVLRGDSWEAVAHPELDLRVR